MPVFVESKRKNIDKLKAQYQTAHIIDVTSKGQLPYLKLSPFYPHGNIPVPFSPGYFSQSVEAVWQGLKVFENFDVDTDCFKIKDMKGIKRTVRKYGRVLGHRKGVHGQELLEYVPAKQLIYLPTYLWVLENCVSDVISSLQELSQNTTVVLLDYETADDVNSATTPLSHAFLCKLFIEGKYPVM